MRDEIDKAARRRVPRDARKDTHHRWEVLLTGSVNLTDNGMENNKEHLYRIVEPSAVADVLADFETEWAAAEKEEVTSQTILEMEANWHKRDDEKKNRRSVSRSADRGASRSLSLYLDAVREEEPEQSKRVR